MPFTRTPKPRELRADLALAAVILVGGLLSAALSSISGVYGPQQNALWTAIPYLLVLTLAVAVRRRRPAEAAIVVAIAYAVAVTLRIPEVYAGNIAMFVTLYTVGAWMNSRRGAFLVRVGIITAMGIWLVIVMYREAIEQADKAAVSAALLSPYVAMMMLNVLLNARQAMEGGGRLMVAAALSPDGRAVDITVADTGHGIPPDTLAQVFEPYFTPKPGGSGIGLAVTRKIVTDHRGTIDIESGAGQGTTVRMSLPVEKEEMKAA